jgi:hypothetical protein
MSVQQSAWTADTLGPSVLSPSDSPCGSAGNRPFRR